MDRTTTPNFHMGLGLDWCERLPLSNDISTCAQCVLMVLNCNHEIFCTVFRGESFRTEFAKLGEVRSLIHESVRIMALTATATKSSRRKICQTLGMVKPDIIAVSPNRPNIEYKIECKRDTIEEQYSPLVEELRRKRTMTDRSVIFCRSYTDCGYIYLFFKNRLGNQRMEPMDAPDLARFRLVDMFSACTTKDVKDSIRESFQQLNSALRILIATIAFGMGLDCPNIRRIFHYGPATDIESYLQETGRAGRDGKQATATLYYAKRDFCGNYIDESMKKYCLNNSVCRRKLLLEDFDDDETTNTTETFVCCDLCFMNRTVSLLST